MTTPVTPTYNDPRLDVALATQANTELPVRGTYADRGLVWIEDGQTTEAYSAGLAEGSFFYWYRQGKTIFAEFSLIVDTKGASITGSNKCELLILDASFKKLYNASNFRGQPLYTNYIQSPEQVSITTPSNRKFPYAPYTLNAIKKENDVIGLEWSRVAAVHGSTNPQGEIKLAWDDVGKDDTDSLPGQISGTIMFTTTE